MKTLLKSFTLGVLTLASMASLAHESPDLYANCYLFQNNKLKTKSVCINKSGGGAGGNYDIFLIGKKKYHFNTSTMSEDEPTVYYESKNKTIDVVKYQRNPKNLRILTDKQIQTAGDRLWCYKTIDNKLDICSD